MPPDTQKQRAATILSAIQSLCGTIVIAVFVITFAVQAFQIPSESMENTLLIGDYLLVDKVHFGDPGHWRHLLPYQPIQRGEIIVFRYPINPQQHFVKRVIGLPGDHVRIINKQVRVNGQPISEKYTVFRSPLHDPYRDEFPVSNWISANVDPRWWLQMRRMVQNGELLVPSGYYFVLGDNRDESLDSRYWGFVPRENIIGRPLLIYLSVRQSGDDDPSTDSPRSRFSQLAYAVAHAFENLRWRRIFRLVR